MKKVKRAAKKSAPRPAKKAPAPAPRSAPKKPSFRPEIGNRSGHFKLEPGNKTGLQYLSSGSAQRYIVEDVPGDGNCFFRALAKALGDNTPNAHLQLRNRIVNYVKQMYDTGTLPTGETQLDFDSLLQPGVWNKAAMDYIPAFANRVINRTLVIHRVNDIPVVYEVVGTEPIHILYVNRNHYTALRPQS